MNRYFGKIISRSTYLNLQVKPLTKYSIKIQTRSDRNKRKIQILKYIRNLQSTSSVQECFKIIWFTKFERKSNKMFSQLRRWGTFFFSRCILKVKNWRTIKTS